MQIKKSWLFSILAFVGFVATLALGIVLIPGVTELGETILKIILAIGILAYIGFFLVKKLVKERGMVLILVIVETVVMFLVALGLILSQFDIIKISEACKIIGIAVWMRGVIGLFSGYIRRNTVESRKKYDVAFFFINILLVSLGTWMFAKPFITNYDMIIVLIVITFLISIGLLVFGIMSCPALKKGGAKTKKTKTVKAKPADKPKAEPKKAETKPEVKSEK